jgi:UPF0755 protein
MAERYRENTAEARRTRGSAMARVIGSLLALIVLAALLVGGAVAYGYMQATTSGPLSAPKIVDFSPDMSRSEVAARLQDAGVINNPLLFATMTSLNSLRGRNLTLGEYSFPAGVTLRDVMRIMQNGKVVTYKFTIPEGFTTAMAIERLNKLEAVQGVVEAVPEEGTMLANTFHYTRRTDPNELVLRIKAQQDELVDAIWAKRPADTPLKSKLELVTLASIVEKETGKASERPLVAAVFLNRLKKGIRLQSDPTIIYGLVGGKGKLDRPISRADIDSITPYNTYQIDGLPPGPIAIPGKDALEAVVMPAAVDYIYFVADGTGGHAFARTLDEHNTNVAKWRAGQGQGVAPEAEELAPSAPAAVEPAPPAQTNTSLTATGLDNVVPEPTPAPAPVAQAAPPVEPAAASGDEEPVLDVEPGIVLRVGERLIPIPAERRATQ